MNNINDTYFDGYYKDIWKAIIPAALTLKEVDFICQYFNLQPGNKVLDIMCGYGRHAIALAERGVKVTAIDNLPEYINEVRKTALEHNLPLEAIQADVIQYHSGDLFDLAICMGNSLNFFNAEETDRLLSGICAQLKTKGQLLINSWSVAEIVIRDFAERSEGTVGDMKMVTQSSYLFRPTRIETTTVITTPDGTTESKKAIDYIFSVAEMETMLNKAGFSVREIYSIPGRKKFSIGEPRIYIVAEKTE